MLMHFTKMKKLWDELTCLRSFPICEYGASKEITEISEGDRLVLFLMGLNNSYVSVRNRILLMDPLPSVNKVFSLILRVEKQIKVSTNT